MTAHAVHRPAVAPVKPKRGARTPRPPVSADPYLGNSGEVDDGALPALPAVAVATEADDPEAQEGMSKERTIMSSSNSSSSTKGSIKGAVANQSPGVEVTISDMLADMPGITDTSAPNQGAAGGPTSVLDHAGRAPGQRGNDASR